MALFADIFFQPLYEIHGIGALEQFAFVSGVLLLNLCPFEGDPVIEEWVEMLKAPEFVYAGTQ